MSAPKVRTRTINVPNAQVRRGLNAIDSHASAIADELIGEEGPERKKEARDMRAALAWIDHVVAQVAP